MANLKKREIIILVIAALFVLYAGYVYLIAGPASKKVNPNADSVKIETFKSDLTNDLSKNKLSDFDTELNLNIAEIEDVLFHKIHTDWIEAFNSKFIGEYERAN